MPAAGPAPRRLENLPVTLAQLIGGQPAAQRIVDVRVGTCLVQQKIAAGKARHALRYLREKALGLISAIPFRCGRIMRHPVELQAADDVGRAVAVMLVEIEDADAQARPASTQRRKLPPSGR